MKHYILLWKTLAVFLLLTIVACKPRKASIPNTSNVNRQWMMIGFKNYKKEELIKNKATLDLSNHQSSANVGCNIIGFQVAIKNASSISFSNINSTKMFCMEVGQLENDFITALPKVTSYNIEGHFLTLTNSNGETIKFVAADWD